MRLSKLRQLRVRAVLVSSAVVLGVLAFVPAAFADAAAPTSLSATWQYVSGTTGPVNVTVTGAWSWGNNSQPNGGPNSQSCLIGKTLSQTIIPGHAAVGIAVSWDDSSTPNTVNGHAPNGQQVTVNVGNSMDSTNTNYCAGATVANPYPSGTFTVSHQYPSYAAFVQDTNYGLLYAVAYDVHTIGGDESNPGKNGDNSVQGSSFNPTLCSTIVNGLNGSGGSGGGTGNRGPTGPKGVTGASVLSGNGAPSSTVGNNGDFYIDLTTYKIYGPKAGGVWPTTGTNMIGAKGVTGAAGSSVLSGNGAPSSTVGNNGDFYLNLVTDTLYGPKAAGAWPASGTSLVGAKGAKGATGATGAAGAAGAVGAAGSSVLSGNGVPSSTVGNNGDFYLNLVTDTLYGPKAAGAWPVSGTSLIGAKGATGAQGPAGVAGLQGAAGAAGAAGSSVLSGNGAPSSTVGNNGDFYLNLVTDTFYGPKAGGSWPASGTSLIGATGATGAAGATGAQGPAVRRVLLARRALPGRRATQVRMVRMATMALPCSRGSAHRQMRLVTMATSTSTRRRARSMGRRTAVRGRRRAPA